MPTLTSAYNAARRTKSGAVVPASRAIVHARKALDDCRAKRAELENIRAPGNALADVERRALYALSNANGRAGEYDSRSPWARGFGPGTWQGGDAAPDYAAKFLPGPPLPIYRQPSRMATAQHSGAGGNMFAAHDEEAGGALRNVMDAHDVPGARLGHAGWYDNPHGESARDGSGLVIGVVGQLRGRDGLARYVPGYRFGGHDDHGAFDLRDVYVATGPDECDAEEARADCARRADQLAERAAEKERQYQTAWGAGQRWAEMKEEEEEARTAARAILAERREARRMGTDFPAMCRAIRDSVAGYLETIQANRKERAELAQGDCAPWLFYPGPEERDAFCDGAELDAFPA